MYRYLRKLMTGLVMAGTVVSLGQNVQAVESISVGVLQYVEHPSLDQNYKGFVDGLKEAGYEEGKNLTLNYINASANTSNLQSMSEKLAGNDYLFAIATPAAQALANVVTDKPIYFSAVTDPVSAGLVKSLDKPGTNLTGTIDAGPLAEQIDLIKIIVPEATKVGLIYNSGEANSVSEADKAQQILKEKGLTTVVATVTSTNDINTAMTSLIDKKVQAIFTVTDNTIASAMSLVGSLAIDAKIPIIGGSKDMILENGLATYGLDYYELGKQTAKMLVNQIEKGTPIQDIPVEKAANLEVVLNQEVGKQLGLDMEKIKAEIEKTQAQ